MYRAYKRISDREIEILRAPESRFKASIRRELLDALILKIEEENMNIEDFLIRYTSRRDFRDDLYGRDWFTEYAVAAVPLANARDIVWRGY